MKKGTIKLLAYAAAAIMLLAGLTYLRDFLEEKDEQAEIAENNGRKYAPFVEESHPLYQRYIQAHPEKDILLACVGDLTDDGIDELVVIYRADPSGPCETVVLVQEAPDSYYETPPTPAPQQHQKMRFFNMDKKGELELLVTGDKDGEVGYAIYSIIDRELINLFGEGMEDCC